MLITRKNEGYEGLLGKNPKWEENSDGKARCLTGKIILDIL